MTIIWLRHGRLKLRQEEAIKDPVRKAFKICFPGADENITTDPGK